MTAPLSEEYLAEVEAALDGYAHHAPTGFACCSAHAPADMAGVLLAEVRRLRKICAFSLDAIESSPEAFLAPASQNMTAALMALRAGGAL